MEVVVVLHVVAVWAVLRPFGVTSYTSDFFHASVRAFGDIWFVTMVSGPLVRLLAKRLLRKPSIAPSKDFLVDGPRLLVLTILLIHGYTWLKVMIPLVNPANFDQLLWDVDRWLGLGLQPNVFFLTLFSAPLGLRLISVVYGPLFETSLLLTGFWFLTEPHRARRWGFATGMILIWIVGCWLYLAIPALGPCFRFEEIYQAYAEHMEGVLNSQKMLAGNYYLMLKFAETGQNQLIVPAFGIAAFPSLHVGHVAFLYFWCRRLRSRLTTLLGLLTMLMFIGSIVTGWHYTVDSIAGLILAWGGVAAGRWIAWKEFGIDPFAPDEEIASRPLPDAPSESVVESSPE